MWTRTLGLPHITGFKRMLVGRMRGGDKEFEPPATMSLFTTDCAAEAEVDTFLVGVLTNTPCFLAPDKLRRKDVFQ